jgi:hypothetical protein
MTPRALEATRRPVMIARVLRATRRPVVSVRRLGHRLATAPGLPLGRIARMRRLLETAVSGQERLLAIGLQDAIRRVWPSAVIDVVGTDPTLMEVNVVSDALGEGSLPRRWECVVVAEHEPTSERLAAAAGACLPGGLVVVVTPGRSDRHLVPGAHSQRRAGSRGAQLVVARMPS